MRQLLFTALIVSCDHGLNERNLNLFKLITNRLCSTCSWKGNKPQLNASISWLFQRNSSASKLVTITGYILCFFRDSSDPLERFFPKVMKPSLLLSERTSGNKLPTYVVGCDRIDIYPQRVPRGLRLSTDLATSQICFFIGLLQWLTAIASPRTTFQSPLTYSTGCRIGSCVRWWCTVAGQKFETMK